MVELLTRAEVVSRLEDRIWRLKQDHIATKEWFELRRFLESKGGRWSAENGTIFLLQDGAIYQCLREDGVTECVVTNMDAPIPYGAVLHVDLQGTPPGRRMALLKELDERMKQTRGTEVEIVTIVRRNWLTKISMARWKTSDWKRHLKPTAMTLAARKARGRSFNPDLIYPGDTFEVIV